MKNLVIPALVALSLTACNSDTTFSQKNKSGTVLATVNGSAIIEEDVTAALTNLPANLLQGREAQVKANVVDQLVERELVLQDADKQKVYNNEEFQKLYKDLTRNLAYNFMVAKAAEKAVTEEALLAEYEKNKANYVYKSIKASHILLPTEKEATAIVTQLEKGSNFAELAKEKSTGPSGVNGGELGWFKANDMVPAFSQAAFALADGDFTKQPVKTQFGWHVILREESKDDMATFEMVRQPLQQNMQNIAVQTYVTELKKAAKIDIIKKAEKATPTPPTNDVVRPVNPVQ